MVSIWARGCHVHLRIRNLCLDARNVRLCCLFLSTDVLINLWGELFCCFSLSRPRKWSPCSDGYADRFTYIGVSRPNCGSTYTSTYCSVTVTIQYGSDGESLLQNRWHSPSIFLQYLRWVKTPRKEYAVESQAAYGPMRWMKPGSMVREHEHSNVHILI